MFQIFTQIDNQKAKCICIEQQVKCAVFFDKLVPQYYGSAGFYITSNGHLVSDDQLLQDGATYHISPRILGGKGGFGSMLRSIGAQIEKTTSREACRDLSGRRMRDINNEKKLKDWLSKKGEREQKRAERRRLSLEKKLHKGKHVFDDRDYHDQKAQVADNLEDALTVGLGRSVPAAGGSAQKRPHGEISNTDSKKKCDWMDMGLDSEDSDSNSSDSSLSDEEFSDAKLSPASGGAISSTASSETETSTNAINTPPENSADICASGQDRKLQSSEIPERIAETSAEQVMADLDHYKSVEELASVGLEALKTALMERGLKCGGSLQERAERLYSVKGLNKDEIDPSLFASKGKGKGKKSKKS